MMTYGELNLKKLRDECGLDFAHFTYQRGQCSCCYGPQDMPDRYWAKGKKPKKIMVSSAKDYDGEVEQWDRSLDSITYILFKNAENGSGTVTRNDTICVRSKDDIWSNRGPTKRVCIEWNFPLDKMDLVLQSLRCQLDDDYEVLRPRNGSCNYCLEIVLKKDLLPEDESRIFHLIAMPAKKRGDVAC